MTICEVQRSPGCVIEYTNSGTEAIAAKEVIEFAGSDPGIGVALEDIAAGATGTVVIAGRARMDAKADSTEVWDVFDKIYYDGGSADALTIEDSGNTYAGIALLTKAADECVGTILLNKLTGK